MQLEQRHNRSWHKIDTPITRQVFLRPKVSLLTVCSDMAWSQRSSDKRWEPEERHAQAGIYIQRFAKAKLTQKTEYVQGDSSSASAWSFIPKVNVGAAPYEGATKPKGSIVPKDAVGSAKGGDKPTTPRICRLRRPRAG